MRYLDKVQFARQLIIETHKKFDANQIFLASSFGKDSIVLMHLALSIIPNVNVLSLISDTEFQETYDYIDKLILKWNINCKKIYFEQAELVRTNPQACCRDKKVEAMREAIIGMECWFSGIRNTEGKTRENIQPIESVQGITKINPLIYFTELDIWRYIAVNSIEVHPLYAEGYRSLGCKNCSQREIDSEESERDGRWGGLDCQGGECGIHTEILKT
ncbi:MULTISPECIES: phosphoadenylyl-sulfate reductase [unclassified Legionella]|uniref:phosphoadenylyl-sulfate reductase n=1 Tax=unclassified Legionella TaxID=2622702 RepID=UPI001054311A|nr:MULTISPECIES: phosphoadenylyl-sulfate reductase [unclassified Legionella]MDI9818027.1 phosphoadenylyl-sulfate reductase [Legionella sp. PL877]